MMIDKRAYLESFGKALIEGVRDHVYESVLGILEGSFKSPSLVELHENLAKISPEHIETIKRLSLETIDSTIYYFLWMIEQSDADENGLDLIQKTSEGSFSLKDYSDGLYGESYTEDGWISQYSKYPSSEQD